MASFLLDEASGADEIELDIRITADAVPVVRHDPTIERVAAVPGPLTDIPVVNLTLAQLLTVTLKSAQPLLTFAEALEATTSVLQVEIKESVPAVAELLRFRPSDSARLKFSSFLPANWPNPTCSRPCMGSDCQPLG